MGSDLNKKNKIFFNYSFDKKRLKALISWVFKQSGEAEALKVVDLLKETGFRHATKAGISIGLHDLSTPIQKSWLISESQQAMNTTERDFVGARITATERSQRIIDTWHRASESLSKQVVDYFGIYDNFNPVYIMALSGARGNFSQVRQLIGMRGLMADQQGKIVNFPIRSNLREGLTLTEYFISCSGARKGLVDTALRTADTGYLTRRLVDVSHHVVVKRIRCNTNRGVAFRSLQSYNKILLALKERLVGRVLAEDIFLKEASNKAVLYKEACKAKPLSNLVDTLEGGALQSSLEGDALLGNTNPSFVKALANKAGLSPALLASPRIARKDQEISLKLSLKIAEVRDVVYLRSPLTCGFTHTVCQLCYGWSISQGSLVSLGDAVGVIAAQSIGEPGTQLTMRTFHTGGVFSGDLLQEIKAPDAGEVEFSKAFQGLLIRTAHGRIAFLSKTPGSLVLKHRSALNKKKNRFTTIPIPAFTMLFVRQGEKVESNQLLAEFSIRTKEGNQPIKTQQTIFAELSGRLVEDCTGKVYTKAIKESAFSLDTLESHDRSYFTDGELVDKSTACEQSLSPSQKKEESFRFKERFAEPLVYKRSLTNNDALQRFVFSRSSLTYSTNPFTQKPATVKPYVTQLVSSFSSYNGYISAFDRQRLTNQRPLKAPIKSRYKAGLCMPLKAPIKSKILEAKKILLAPLEAYKARLCMKILLGRVAPLGFKIEDLIDALKAQQGDAFKNGAFTGLQSRALLATRFVRRSSLVSSLRIKSKALRVAKPSFVRRVKSQKHGFLLREVYANAGKQSSVMQRFANKYKSSYRCKAKLCTAGGLQISDLIANKSANKIFFARGAFKGLRRHTNLRFVRRCRALYRDFKGLQISDLSAKLCKPKALLKPIRAKMKKLDVLHSVQDTMLEKIFDTKLTKSDTPCAGKRFSFLNEIKKKQSFMYKAQIVFSQKSEDIESDTFKYIEPALSGRLGFLKIISSRVGASLDYMSPLKPEVLLRKKRKTRFVFETSSTLDRLRRSKAFTNRNDEASPSLIDKYLHPQSVKENRFFLQTIAEYGDIVEEGYSY